LSPFACGAHINDSGASWLGLLGRVAGCTSRAGPAIHAQLLAFADAHVTDHMLKPKDAQVAGQVLTNLDDVPHGV
jgi:hypothetical protein